MSENTLTLADIEATPPHVQLEQALFEVKRVIVGQDRLVERLVTALRRLANVAANPRVAALVDHYEGDWSALWWVRADGLAVVTEDPSAVDRAVGLLREKYEQYRTVDVHGPVIEVSVHAWRGWSAA